MVVRSEATLLSQEGHEVDVFSRTNDEIKHTGLKGKLVGALCTPWNPVMSRALRARVEEFRPGVVHVHNTFPLLSPAIFHAIGNLAARILTLHNYRLFCPAAIPMRDGRVCTDCMDRRSPIPSLFHGCYRDSRLATLPLALSVGLHRAIGTWTKQVDAFICLTEFQRQLMVAAGLPIEKVHVKPNFYPGNPSVRPWIERKPHIVYVGRLTAEKGVVTLVKAWQKWGSSAPELHVIGSGELRTELERMAEGLPVRFWGQLTPHEVHERVSNAQLLVLPSECFETFGLTVVEAFAHGTPAAVSRIGPLPTIVTHRETGIVFDPANVQSLLEEVQSAWIEPGLMQELGCRARAEFESKYTEDKNYTMLMEIYRQAIEVSRKT